jgi:hypothetical protein
LWLAPGGVGFEPHRRNSTLPALPVFPYPFADVL